MPRHGHQQSPRVAIGDDASEGREVLRVDYAEGKGRGCEMNDTEIRFACLHLAFRERKLLYDHGFTQKQEDWLVRAEEIRKWAMGEGLPNSAAPDTPSAPETGPELPEHTGWAG